MNRALWAPPKEGAEDPGKSQRETPEAMLRPSPGLQTLPVDFTPAWRRRFRGLSWGLQVTSPCLRSFSRRNPATATVRLDNV